MSWLLEDEAGPSPSALARDAGFDPDGRAQVLEIVSGVRRRQWLLDAILRRFLDRPIDRSSPPLRAALRLGVFDLLFRPQVPAPMVVSECVALAGKSQKGRGFLNAVLRKVAAGFTFTTAPSARDRHTLWLEGDRWARFELPVLPDPAEDPAAWDALHFTLPVEFVRGIREVLPLEAFDYFVSTCTPLPMILRPIAPVGLDALEVELRAEGAEILKRRESAFEIAPRAGLEALTCLREGRASAQDDTASEVVPLLELRPGERVLDLCAAPGGKARQIALAIAGRGGQPAGQLVASDKSPRLDRLRENLTPYSHAVVHDLGRDGQDLPPGPFHAILVDAPCSNSGVLAKRVEARFRLRDQDLSQLEVLQDALLDRAASLLAPGGRMVYATCSVIPGENHARVRAFLTRHPEFTLETEFLRWPHRTGRDGGYAARLRRPPSSGS